MLDINVQDQIVSKCKADFNPYMNSYVGFIATHAIMNYLDSTLSVVSLITFSTFERQPRQKNDWNFFYQDHITNLGLG